MWAEIPQKLFGGKKMHYKYKVPYTPQKHQEDWHNCSTRFLVAVCGRQIGKSTAAVNELIRQAIKPDQRVWYVTNDYKQAKRNVWDLLLHYTPKELIHEVNKSDLMVKLKTGSKIELIGVENAESLRGAVVHFMVNDEYADFPRHIWPTVLRPMLSTTEGKVWFIGTPKGLGNDLYDKYYLESERFTKFKMPACEIQDGIVVNPLSKYTKLDELQAAYEEDKTSNKEYFSQEYLAEFTRRTGSVYSEWKMDNFIEVPYDPYAPLHISWDFGVNDPTAVIWIQPVRGEFRVIDYYEASNANIEHFIQVIRGKPYKEASLHTGDDAGNARTLTTGTSPIQELAKHGIHVRTTSGLKIVDQIRTTHKYIPSLFVDNKLKRFRDCLLNYHYPETKEGMINQSNEKPVHDEFSHAMRALEYYFCNYLGEPSPRPKKDLKSKWRLG